METREWTGGRPTHLQAPCPCKFLLAQLSMPVGPVAAVWFVLARTGSGLRHMGGPIDWLVMLGVAAAGAVGLALLVYVVQSLIWRPRADAAIEVQQASLADMPAPATTRG